MVMQFDVMSQTYSLVHYTQSPEFLKGTASGQGAFEPLDPIVKRTPQERVESLMQRFIEDCLIAGTVPGLDDARISAIVGASWEAGRSQVTGEVIRSIAANLLQEAENRKKVADYKKVVTPSPND